MVLCGYYPKYRGKIPFLGIRYIPMIDFEYTLVKKQSLWTQLLAMLRMYLMTAR